MATSALTLTISLIILFQLQLVTNEDFRLSYNVKPLKYIVKITPYFQDEDRRLKGTFNGSTVIYFETEYNNIKTFEVNAEDLNIDEVRINSADKKPLTFSFKYDERTTKMIFQLADNISLDPCSPYELSFEYKGQISNGSDGLFQRSYIDSTGNKKYILATNLQATNARKLFPCFDDPRFKTPFTISVSRPKEYITLSNSGEKTAISSFQVALKLRKTYGTLFNIPYFHIGIIKLILVAVPYLGDRGGTEAFSLMTFDKKILIYELDDEASEWDRQLTITIISHRMFHQWIGNLVSIEWWSYFWLTEGFGVFYEYYLTHRVFSEYELDKQFIVEQLHKALDEDDNISTRPLNIHTISSNEEIESRNGDIITSAKGASVIRMLYHLMDQSTFDSIIQRYIQQNAHNTTNLACLQDVIDWKFSKTPTVIPPQFLFYWTEQVGYPMLEVTLADNGLSVKVNQRRYAPLHDGSDNSLRYIIPLTYTTSEQRNFTYTVPIAFFYQDKHEVSFQFSKPVKWVVFNIQQTSFYRVMYDKKLWQTLHDALCEKNWSSIHENNRAQYIDDLLAFGKVGIFNYDTVFKWLEFLKHETHYIPWKAAFNKFSEISSYFTLKEHADFGKFILFVTDKVFKKLGIIGKAGEPVLDGYLRKMIVNINCRYGGENCTKEVKKIFTKYLYDGTLIPVDMRETIYCAGMRNASGKDYDMLFSKFESAEKPREKLRIRYGLSCGRDPKNVKKYFELVLSEHVPVEEKESALIPLFAENKENVRTVYLMATDRYIEMAISYQSPITTAILIKKVVEFLDTREERKDFENFLTKHRHEFSEWAAEFLDEAYLNMDDRLKYAQAYLDPLRKYLREESWKKKSGSTINFLNLFMITLPLLSYVLF